MGVAAGGAARAVAGRGARRAGGRRGRRRVGGARVRAGQARRPRHGAGSRLGDRPRRRGDPRGGRSSAASPPGPART
ncbi:hypothetical protein ACFSTC_40030 [Nonomuraea ferruginea]